MATRRGESSSSLAGDAQPLHTLLEDDNGYDLDMRLFAYERERLHTSRSATALAERAASPSKRSIRGDGDTSNVDFQRVVITGEPFEHAYASFDRRSARTLTRPSVVFVLQGFERR